jgi:hypothetical protein
VWTKDHQLITKPRERERERSQTFLLLARNTVRITSTPELIATSQPTTRMIPKLPLAISTSYATQAGQPNLVVARLFKFRDLAMKGASSVVVLKDFTSEASNFFGNVRTPAGLVAGSALGSLFTFSEQSVEESTTTELTLLRVYLVSMLISFTLSLTTIIISTGADISLIHGGFDRMAETAYQLLRREFDYEFSVTRWSFLVSLLSFLSGVTVRIVLQFKLLMRQRRNHLIGVVGAMTAVVTHLLSYVNQTLYCWPNLFAMTVHVVKLIMQRATTGQHPLEIISVLSTVVGIVFLGRVLLLGSSNRAPKSKTN